VLRAHRDELVAVGVMHAGIFGSVARGEAGPESDIDVLVEFAPGQPRDVFAYVGVQQQVAALLPGKVDVIDLAAMRPELRARVQGDRIDAF
jgi:hypothetical protein